MSCPIIASILIEKIGPKGPPGTAGQAGAGAGLYGGPGDPNGIILAAQYSLYTDDAGGLWRKSSPGTTNIGWEQLS